MPRGGARPGSGPKPKNPKAKVAPVQKPVAYTARGVKTEEAPQTWPFGTEPDIAPVAAPIADLSQLTPLDYLLSVVRDVGAEDRVRIQAASIAAPFCHAKVADAGKKNDAQDAAKRVGAGKFASSAPPLKLVNRH